MTHPKLIEVAKAIDGQLAFQEALLADPLTLRMLMAKRAARAAIQCLMEPTSDMNEAGRKIDGYALRGVDSVYWAMLTTILNGKGEG